MLMAENICQPTCITSERWYNAGQKVVNECAHKYKELFLNTMSGYAYGMRL